MTSRPEHTTLAWPGDAHALEQAATPGPWVPERDGDPHYIDNLDGIQVAEVGVLPDAAWVIDARSRLPTALGAIVAVLALHRTRIGLGTGLCEACDQLHPCPTVTALADAIEEGRP